MHATAAAALLSCYNNNDQEQTQSGYPDETSSLQARLLALLSPGAGHATGLATLLSQGQGMGRFCAAHSCQGDAGRCGDEVVSGSEDINARPRRGYRRGSTHDFMAASATPRLCSRHRCSRVGCAAEATHWSRRGQGLCRRHDRVGREDGAYDGGFGPGNMNMPMPVGTGTGTGMGMRFGLAPFYGVLGCESSESSDSDDERSPSGMPFGRYFR